MAAADRELSTTQAKVSGVPQAAGSAPVRFPEASLAPAWVCSGALRAVHTTWADNGE